MRDTYPLQWPDNWPRTPKPRRARFVVASFARSRDRVLHLVGRLSGARGVITSNLPTRNDGLPYANASEPSDRGVAVYWVQGGVERVMPCDRWDSTRDNLHAIELSIEAMLGLERWGASAIVERAFAGFAALPPAPDWRAVLGLPSKVHEIDITLEDVKRRFRDLARDAHPDTGGDKDWMQRLNEAYAAAQIELGVPPR